MLCVLLAKPVPLVEFCAAATTHEGDDRITKLDEDTFNGGPGDDWTRTLNDGIFNGGAGNDTVSLEGEGGAIPSGMFGWYFNSGEGDDTIYNYQGDDYTSVESVLNP